jgi:hypothetical protein
MLDDVDAVTFYYAHLYCVVASISVGSLFSWSLMNYQLTMH